jgi:hypothetical protein
MDNKENYKYGDAKRLVKADGTIAYVFDNQYHNWEGPALIPEGNKRKREYYLNGIKLTEKQWKDARRNRSGLPFYKQAGMNVRN